MTGRPDAVGSPAPAAGQCYVTVQHGRRRMDVALPSMVPILEVTPQLAALCGAGEAQGQRSGSSHGTPPAWVLARPGGRAIDPLETLEDAHVLDGEVLHLVDGATWRAPVVSDVADAVAGAIEGDPFPWPGEAGRWLLGGLGAACLVSAAGVAAATGVLAGPGALAALALAVLLCLVTLSPLEIARGGVPRPVLAAAAVTMTALAAWGLAGGRPVAVGIAAAAGGVLLALFAVGRAVPAIAPGGMLAAAVLVAGAAGVARGAAPDAVAAVVAVAGVLALRTWPPVVGKALSALGSIVPATLAVQAAHRTRRLLASLSGATAALLLGAVLALLASGRPFALGLAAACCLALLLRARTYRFLVEALPPALAVVLSLLAAEVLAVQRLLLPRGGAVQAVALLACGGLVALGGTRLLPARVPAPGRGVRLTWLAIDAALAPLLLGTLGVLDLLPRLVHHLVH